MTGTTEALHVAVVGAGLAGLLSAAAASGPGRRVTVLERDTLPSGPLDRPGVAQGRQPHVFLFRGLLAVETLLPGVRAELVAAGALPFDTGQLAWLGEHGWVPFGGPGFEVLSASRPLFEHVVRSRVRELPGVRLVDGARVRGLRRRSGRWVVEASDGGADVEADVVVDASGRGSRLTSWLEPSGVPPPPTTVMDSRLGYATRVYAARADAPAVPGVVVLATPSIPRGGLALRVEGDRWLVGAVGYGERPPRDVAGYEAFLRSLRDPALAELVRRSEPLSDVATHRQTANVRRRYDRVRAWPGGLLVVGDAACAFNPVYGQGITVAACQALVLRRALDSSPPAAAPDGAATRRLLRLLAREAAVPWAIATGQDGRYLSGAAHRSLAQAALDRWTGELSRLAAHGEHRPHAVLVRLYHLMGSPVLLADPRLVAAAVRTRVAGYDPPVGRPAPLATG